MGIHAQTWSSMAMTGTVKKKFTVVRKELVGDMIMGLDLMKWMKAIAIVFEETENRWVSIL